MNELEQTLIGDSAAAPPDHILEGLSEQLAHTPVAGAPHTIYQELWHLAFWQQISLDWIAGIETLFPEHAALGFPTTPTITQTEAKPWEQLRQRFPDGAQHAVAIARDTQRLDQPIRCPSSPDKPTRIMTVRGQLESLAAHNAYHLGRIVLLRQLHQSWPPTSGGFTW